MVVPNTSYSIEATVLPFISINKLYRRYEQYIQKMAMVLMTG